MPETNYDVIVIGSGPGGYVCAIRCAQLGLKTAVIEKYDSIGGTCLNVGCIPSKAFLDSSEHFHNIKTNFHSHGIEIGEVKMNLNQFQERKRKVIQNSSKGIEYLFKKNHITLYHGLASFIDSQSISIEDPKGKTKTLQGQSIVLATGSKPMQLKGLSLDKKHILSSTEALEMKQVPKKVLLVGGGIIAMEMGSVYASLGAEVEVLEYLDRIIANMDPSLSKALQKSLSQKGFTFHLSHQVLSGVVKQKQVHLKAKDSNGKEVSFSGELCLVVIGRRAYTEGLALERIGISVDSAGRVPVSEDLESVVKGVYAIGDLVRGPMLAHKASEEGVFVAEKLAGQKPKLHYSWIPSVVYTWPEAAGVGLTEPELKDQSIPYKSGSFPFQALGRARASMNTEGLVKVLCHAQTDEILGMHILGARAADLIGVGVMALAYRSSAEDLARLPFAHPTFSEAIKEACLSATENRTIHI